VSDLATDPEHGGVTDNDLESFFAANPDLRPLAPHPGRTLSNDLPSVDSGVPDGDEGEETPAESDPSSPSLPEPGAEPEEGESVDPDATSGLAQDLPDSSSPDFLDIDGQHIPRSQVEAAARFQQQLVNDPQLRNLIQNYLAGTTVTEGLAASPTGEGSAPVGPPEELDLDDPQVRVLYTLLQQQSEQMSQLQRGVDASLNAHLQTQRQSIDSAWATASQSFAKDHDLSLEEVNMIGQVAARMNVAQGFAQTTDPITGMPREADPVWAMTRALDTAMMQIPEYRDREFRRSVEQQQKDARKKKNLGAVGGNSGSVSRVVAPPKPGTAEARAAMNAEVAQMLSGEWSDPASN
jgi:hypothetical protein